MTSYINRNVTRGEVKPALTREIFRAMFEHCPRCGLVRDLRGGKYLSEPDSLELEAALKGFEPRIPAGEMCAWCAEEVAARESGRFR